jgi:hypothetical protein
MIGATSLTAEYCWACEIPENQRHKIMIRKVTPNRCQAKEFLKTKAELISLNILAA